MVVTIYGVTTLIYLLTYTIRAEEERKYTYLDKDRIVLTFEIFMFSMEVNQRPPYFVG